MASAQFDIVPADSFEFDDPIYRSSFDSYFFKISLKPGKSWLPSDFIFPYDSLSAPVRVLSMDIGGGLIEFADPVVIGYITKDVDSYDRFVCNNSCPHSFDGVCGDVSKPLYHNYNAHNYFNNGDYIPICNVDTDCSDCGGLDTVILYQNNTPITIDAPEVIKKIYDKSPFVLVNGSGFVEGIKVELMVENWNYDEYANLFNVTLINSNQIMLVKKQNSYWNSRDLITLKSVAIGNRVYYPNDGNGMKLYEVIATPTISESSLNIHDSQSIVFIHASGISDIPEENNIKLSPTLDEAFEVIATKVKTTYYSTYNGGLTLKLKNGYSWSGSTYMTDSQPIKLKIVSIDTGAGIVPSEDPKLFSWFYEAQIFPKTIGTIEKDNLDMICDNSCEYSLTTICNDRTSSKYVDYRDDGKVCAPKTDCIDCGGYGALLPVELHSDSTVFYGSVKLEQSRIPVPTFQSVASSELYITLYSWWGFDASSMSFNLDPPVNIKDFDQVSDNGYSRLILRLKPKKKWPVGELKIVSINDRGDKTISPSYVDKLLVLAIILPDPVIHTAFSDYFNTKSEVITLVGQNFTGDTHVELSPTKVGTYKAISYNENSISLLLHPTASWSSTKMISSKLELKVVGVNSTAGKITFANPVTVGYIVADSDAVKCEDTCKYAYDGVCDQAKSRCASGTDCTDCSIALALLEADSTNNNYDNINAVHSSSKSSDHYSVWFVVSIVIAVLAVIALLLFVYFSYGRSIIGLEPGNAIEMVKYVAVPQVESDCTYI